MNTKHILLLGDAFLLVFAVYVDQKTLLTDGWLDFNLGSNMNPMQLLLLVLVILFSSFMVELYNQEQYENIAEHLLGIIMSIILSFFLLSSLYYLAPAFKIEQKFLLLLIAIFGLLQACWHTVYLSVTSSSRLARRVLILGTGPLAKKIGGIIPLTNCGHTLVGYVNMSDKPAQANKDAVIGNNAELDEIVEREKVNKLVVSLTERRGAFPIQTLLNFKFAGIDVVDAPTFYESITSKLLIENITPSWFIFNDRFKITPTKRFYKRMLDILCATIGVVASAPLIPVVMLLIKSDSRGPVFFKQVRVGERGKNFVIYKFRTMKTDAENKTGAVWAKVNDPRVTRLGGFLRKTRLDEIPQLYNILKGEMSLIGPRPERPEFIEGLTKIIPFYSERHFVKPGLTGWAQIRYPYGSSVEDAIEKLRYDLYYIKNLSAWLDIIILLETIKVILFGRGAR